MNDYKEILETYTTKFKEDGPGFAEEYLKESGVDVTDLPKELAEGINKFLIEASTEEYACVPETVSVTTDSPDAA